MKITCVSLSKKVKSLREKAGQQMLENYQESLNENDLRLIIEKVKSLEEKTQEILDRMRKRKEIIDKMIMIDCKNNYS
jgi:mevalonate pyrophosphate decarboxylase